MKARPIHILALVMLLIVYHYGYIFTRPEMIREVILQKDSFQKTTSIAVDAGPVIKRYFPLGIEKEEALRIGTINGMKVGRGGYINKAEAKVYDETLGLYKNIHRGFAGLENLTGCDNQVIVSLKLKEGKVAHVEGILKKDCIAMP